MKTAFALLVLLLLLTYVQGLSQDSPGKYNYSRNQITLAGMEVLGGWGIVNLSVGAAGWAASKDVTHKSFYQMSTFWGAINTGVAVLGLTGAKRSQQKHLDETGNLKAQQTIEKTFIINGGIDFVYIGTGIYLKSRGNNRDDQKLKGYGSSVIMEGAFLLLFDATMYKLQRRNGIRMRRFLEKNSITFTGNNVGITHSF